MCKITFKGDITLEFPLEKLNQPISVLDFALQNDVNISTLCGGAAICKQCGICVENGKEFLDNKDEERDDEGDDLACQTLIRMGEGPIYIKIKNPK